MPLTLLLALRFLYSPHQEKTISIMLKVCFFSVLIGTFALTLIAAIMSGFEKATYKKLQGVHADLTIDAYDKALDFARLSEVLKKEYAASVEAFSPTNVIQVLIHNKDQQSGQISILKAIDPETEPQVSSLSRLVNSNDKNPWSLLKKDGIFIGQTLADHLKLKTGSHATLIYNHGNIRSSKMSLDEKEVTVVGVFKTGIHEFDETMLLGSFSLAKRLSSPKISQVMIKLRPSASETNLKESLKHRFELDVYSWKDLYPSLVSALTLEKYAMIFILILVTLVSSLNIISLLFMYITQKQIDIALLKTTGMSDFDIKLIFQLISFIITMSATVCGILAAGLMTILLNIYPFIKLPDAYYVTHLPAHLDMHIILCVLLLALIVSVIAAVLPTQKIAAMRVPDVLKGLAT
jgi:lipoprotein-releasing system permease protein